MVFKLLLLDSDRLPVVDTSNLSIFLDIKAVVGKNILDSLLKKIIFKNNMYVSLVSARLVSNRYYEELFHTHYQTILLISGNTHVLNDKDLYHLAKNEIIERVPVVISKTGKIVGILVLLDD